jgi:hypothetical protein
VGSAQQFGGNVRFGIGEVVMKPRNSIDGVLLERAALVVVVVEACSVSKWASAPFQQRRPEEHRPSSDPEKSKHTLRSSASWATVRCSNGIESSESTASTSNLNNRLRRLIFSAATVATHLLRPVLRLHHMTA